MPFIAFSTICALIFQSTNFRNGTLIGTFSLLNGRCKVNNGRMKYMMTLANGVTVKNAILDTPGMGIYCEGNCILQNIYYKKLCYHAAGFGFKTGRKSTPYTYQVIGGAGIGSPDKYFTQSGHGTTIINGFCSAGKFGKLFCSCGNCPHQCQRNAKISNSLLMGPGLTIASLNSNYGDKITISNVTLFGQKSLRTKISFACQEYKALTFMTPKMTPTASYTPSQSARGKSCAYSRPSIRIAN
ncbi:hypothetical protein GPALN_005064 [Globodera pallida]|uniref:Probable pectate lyase F n=1 Tax=Globodera pallida TaxID=36090 RepID=A0A183BRI7_GLOPA|nr:hypothetical protein GPALN_005064 [Globodera pallida]